MRGSSAFPLRFEIDVEQQIDRTVRRLRAHRYQIAGFCGGEYGAFFKTFEYGLRIFRVLIYADRHVEHTVRTRFKKHVKGFAEGAAARAVGAVAGQ